MAKEYTEEDLIGTKKKVDFDIITNLGLNTCDKCGIIEKSEELVWICEDFRPLQGEYLSKHFCKKWADSALCEPCYLVEIKK